MHEGLNYKNPKYNIMSKDIMRKEKLVELTFSELNKINGGGFWKDVGKYFLVS